MPLQFLRDEKLPADAATRVRERLRKVDWFNDRAAEISARCRGEYVAVVDGRLFAANSRKGAYDLGGECALPAALAWGRQRTK